MKFVLFLLFSIVSLHGCTTSDPLQNSPCSVAECVNSGNFNLSTMILCNACMAKVYTNRNTALLFHEIQREIVHGNKFRTKLADLNGDVLFLIFNELNIFEITNLLEVYPAKALISVANEIFWRRYKGYEVYVNGHQDPEGFKINEMRIVGGVGGSRSATLLRLYGGVIEHLNIDNPASIDLQYISKYSSDSLTKLNMRHTNVNPFQHFIRPFSELLDLSLHFETTIKTGALSLNALFPKLQNLKLCPNSDFDEHFIACELTNLKHLKLNVDLFTTVNKRKLYGLLRKNPQIETINIEGDLNEEFCDVINKNVPKLDTLTVLRFEIMNPTRFDHVKNLKFKRYCANIHMLSLPRLISLEIAYSNGISNKAQQFVRAHQSLTHLIVRGIFGNSVPEILGRLTVEFSNLIDIVLEFSDTGRIFEIIRQMIEKNSKLEKINAISCFRSEQEVNRLIETFRNEWNIVDNDIGESTDLMFEKKKN